MSEDKEKESTGRLSPNQEKIIDDDSQEKGENKQETEVMSKRQQKRIKKHERWLQWKAEKRKEERIKKKRKFVEAREKGVDLGPSRKSLKKNCMANSTCKQQVVIDCSFDEYMTDKDVRHLVQQIQHSYSANRRVENPMQYYVTGLDGKTQTRLESIGDYKGWDIKFRTEGYMDLFDKENIVYLSSDSPNVLTHLEDSKVYVIGGLVDHNHHKGLCHQLAVKHKVQHAQLPIMDYIDMKTRKVLTINHVFEILLRYTETGNWKEAFFQVLPLRKGVQEKMGEGTAKDASDDDMSDVDATTEMEATLDSSSIKESKENENDDSTEIGENEKYGKTDEYEDVQLKIESETVGDENTVGECENGSNITDKTAKS